MKSIEENCPERIEGKKQSINSRVIAIYIIRQRKEFFLQRIKKPSCTRKETADIEILITSTKVTVKYATNQNNEWTCHNNEEKKPVQSVQMNIYQSNSYRKDLSWLHFDAEPRAQETQ